MAIRSKTVAVMAVVVVVVLAAFKESEALNLCNMNVEDLMACKPSVTQPEPVEPSAACCDAISHADLKCLCSYKNSTMLPTFGIDPELALGLPAKCGLTPPADC